MHVDQSQYPPGRKPGCLPRKYPPGTVCGFVSDRNDIDIIPQEEWGPYIGATGLNDEVTEIYDQDGVGSCFPAGTMIRMADGSEKAIEKIAVLDEVLTAEGNRRRVTQTMVRDHNGPAIRLLVSGSHHVVCTPEHPVLTEKRGYVPAERLQKGDMIAFPRFLPERNTFIQTMDYVWERRYTGSRRRVRTKSGAVAHRAIPGRKAAAIVRKPLPDIVYLTPGFGRIIGLFVAEGSTCYSKVVFTFAKHEETTLAAELIELLETELGVTANLQIRGNSTVKVNVHGVHWARLFEALCGKLAGGKRVHPDLCAGPREFLESVLSGWTDGDGIGPGRFGGTSVSHSLALGMFDCANATGKMPTLRSRQPQLSHGVKSRQRAWTVEWGEGELRQESDYRKHQTDTHVWRRCEGIERQNFSGHVFNLEVEGDHSYVAEGIGVHNCAAEGAAQGVEVIRACQGQEWVKLNPWYIYRTTSGGSDRGSNIDENLKFLREVGCVPESFWPRYGANGRFIDKDLWRKDPPRGHREIAAQFKVLEFVDVTNTDGFGSCLIKGWPVIFGDNGHAELAVRLIDENTFEKANSWGTNWGNQGFGTHRFSRVNWGYGAWAVCTVTEYE